MPPESHLRLAQTLYALPRPAVLLATLGEVGEMEVDWKDLSKADRLAWAGILRGAAVLLEEKA
jgi:hypothetical protein